MNKKLPNNNGSLFFRGRGIQPRAWVGWFSPSAGTVEPASRSVVGHVMSDVGRAGSVLCRRMEAAVASRLAPMLVALGVAIASGLCGVPPAVAAERSAMVIDANSGAVLYNSSGDEQRYPASLTKMMTLYLTFDLIEKGRLKYSDSIPISAQAAAQPPSKLGLQPGDGILVRDAVRALVTKSANDIAVALAEHIGGSEANFARLMTSKARAIGMSRSTFKNASGLPNDEQVTTARDMLTLALRLQDDFPEHYKVFATRSFAFKGASHRNHNTLLYHYRGTDGIKTGYTRMSGFNLVTSVHRDGRHLVAAVFGGNSAGSRNAEMRALLDCTFVRASPQRTRQRSPQLIAKPSPAKRPAVEVASAAKEKPAAPKPTFATAAAVAAAPLAGKPPRPAVELRVAVAPPPAEVAPAAAAPAAAVPPADDITSKVAVARVRPLLMGNNADGRIATQSNGAIQPAGTAGAPLALAASQESASAIAAAPGRPPSTLHEQLANILASNRREPAAATAPMQTATVEPPTFNLRGPVDAPEATTARVAEAAPTAMPARAGQPRAAAEAVPAVARPAKPAGRAAGQDFLIQIGAYDSVDEAERKLKQARETAAGVLDGSAPMTEAVTKGDRKLYRARFAGFDSARATEACIELRRHSIDCMVAKSR